MDEIKEYALAISPKGERKVFKQDLKALVRGLKHLGKSREEIVHVLKRSRELRKMAESVEDKTAVMAFGRMNPPHGGHGKLIQSVKEIADKHTGDTDHVVYVSRSHGDSKNPLLPQKKMSHLKRMFPGTNFKLSSKEEPNFLHAAAELHKKGYNHLTMVAGSDRINDFHEKLHKYNGPGKLYNFKSIKVVSAGQRDPDGEGSGISATKMREHAVNNNLDEFKKGLPSHITDEHAKELFNDVREGLKGKNKMKKTFKEKLGEVRSFFEQREDIQELAHEIVAHLKKAGFKHDGSEYQGGSKAVWMVHKDKVDINALHKHLKKIDPKARTFNDTFNDSIHGSSKGGSWEVTKLSPEDSDTPNSVVVRLHKKGRVGALSRAGIDEPHLYEAKRLVNRIVEILSKGESALERKAQRYGIPLPVVMEVYYRGLYDKYRDKKHTPEQWAFNRVNSFCNLGDTCFERDRDLFERVDMQRRAKIQQLAKAGLIPQSEYNQFNNIMQRLDQTGDPSKLTTQQRNFLNSVYEKLISLITQDSTVFQRVKKDVTEKKDTDLAHHRASLEKMGIKGPIVDRAIHYITQGYSHRNAVRRAKAEAAAEGL